MKKVTVVVGLILLVLFLSLPARALKVLQGRDFYDYVEVRRDTITAPSGRSVHWILVWNHRRLTATVFEIPSTVDCQGATVHLEPQPNFYRGSDGWKLFIKRRGYIKVVVDNPGVVGECVVEIPCRSYLGRFHDVLPLKIRLIAGNP